MHPLHPLPTPMELAQTTPEPPVEDLTKVKGIHVIDKLHIMKMGHTEAKGTVELKGSMDEKEPTTVKGSAERNAIFSATPE